MNKFYKTTRYLRNIYVAEDGIKGTLEDCETWENCISFTYQEIKQLTLYPENGQIKVEFRKDGGWYTETSLEFENDTDYNEVLQYILQKNPLLKKVRVKQKTRKFVKEKCVHGVIMIILLACLIASAWTLEQKGILTAKGRYSGAALLIFKAADILGVYGSIICSGILLVGYTIFSWKKYKEIKDERDGYRVR